MRVITETKRTPRCAVPIRRQAGRPTNAVNHIVKIAAACSKRAHVFNLDVRRNANQPNVIRLCRNRACYVCAMPTGSPISACVAHVGGIHVATVAIARCGAVRNHVNAPTVGHSREQIGMIRSTRINYGHHHTTARGRAPGVCHIGGAAVGGGWCCRFQIPLRRPERINRICKRGDRNVWHNGNHAGAVLPCGERRFGILPTLQRDRAGMTVVAQRGANSGVVREAHGE